MKTCLGVIAALSLAAGLFVSIPILFIFIPDSWTYRSGKMVITDLRSTRIGAGTDSRAIGYIKEDGKRAVFGDVEQLCSYLGFYDTRLNDTISSSSPPVIPVWYTDRGRAVARFGEGINKPDVPKATKRYLLNIFLVFLPALLIFLYYGWQRWKHAAKLPLLLGCLWAAIPDAQAQSAADFRETIPLSVQLSSVCRAYAHDYGPTGLPVHGCFRSVEAVDLSYPEQVFESMMSSTSAAWDSLHTYGGMAQVKPKPESHYAAVAARDTAMSRFRLLHKLVIYWPDGSRRAFVKFRFEDDASGARPLGLYELIADGSSWKEYPGNINLLQFFALAQTPTPWLQAMLIHPATLPPELATALSPCYASGVFSLETYMRLLAQWVQDPRQAQLLKLLQEDLNW